MRNKGNWKTFFLGQMRLLKRIFESSPIPNSPSLSKDVGEGFRQRVINKFPVRKPEQGEGPVLPQSKG